MLWIWYNLSAHATYNRLIELCLDAYETWLSLFFSVLNFNSITNIKMCKGLNSLVGKATVLPAFSVGIYFHWKDLDSCWENLPDSFKVGNVWMGFGVQKSNQAATKTMSPCKLQENLPNVFILLKRSSVAFTDRLVFMSVFFSWHLSEIMLKEANWTKLLKKIFFFSKWWKTALYCISRLFQWNMYSTSACSLGRMDTFGRSSEIFLKVESFWNYCLLSCTENSFDSGFKGKNSPSKDQVFYFIKYASIDKTGGNILARVTILTSVSIPLQFTALPYLSNKATVRWHMLEACIPSSKAEVT